MKKRNLKPLIQVLKERSCVVFAYLFGSRVTGNMNERSDWDVAVYFVEPGKRARPWMALEVEAELSRAIGGTVQVTVLNKPLTPVFGFEILRYALLLVDKDKNLRTDFETRTLRSYFDWQYFLKRQMESEKQSLEI